MRFEDKFIKEMKNKELSDEFLKKLSERMDSQEGDGREDPEKLIHVTGCTTEQTAHVRVHDEKSRRSIMIRTTAAAAAAVLIFGAAISALYKYKQNQDPGDSGFYTSETVTTVTQNTSVTNQNGEADDKNNTQNKVSDETTTKQSETEPSTVQPEKTEVNFASVDELEDYINARVADRSPLITGYEAAEYSRIYSQFYNVEFTECGYRCTVKDPQARRALAGLFGIYNEDTYNIMQAVSNKTDPDDLDDYSRIISYINKTAGVDNYYIYDAYKYDMSVSIETSHSDISMDTKEKSNYVVEIVLKDCYDKYKKYNINKDDFVVSYAIENTYYLQDEGKNGGEITEDKKDSVLLSEYPYFRKSLEISEKFLEEFNSQYPDYAVTMGNVKYYYLKYYTDHESIFAPYTSWVRNTVNSDEYYKYHIFPYVITACAENEVPDLSEPQLAVNIFFKPGTDESTVISHLNEMKSFFEKYGVQYITTDILKDENDFDRIRSSGGYIPDMLIDSSSSASALSEPMFRYHNVGNNFNSWSSK